MSAPASTSTPARIPTAEELHAAHRAGVEADVAKARAATTLAEKLTQAYGERKIVVEVLGERVRLRYPSKSLRERLVVALSGLRAHRDAIERGELPPQDEQERLQADVVGLAADLALDASMTREFFEASEFGVELAATLLVAVEHQMSVRRADAGNFRKDA